MACTKELTWKPMTGLLDYRSDPDKLPPGSFRMRQGFALDVNGNVGRWGGFSKVFDQEAYNNADLHDQLLSLLDVTGVNETINYLGRLTTTRGVRLLVAGTSSRLYTLNEGSYNWRIIAEGFGMGTTTRFRSAQVGDIVVFTNGYDAIQYWIVEQEGQVLPLADADVIGMSKAARLWAWKGVVFFADVEMDGLRFPNRIVWTDFNNPLSLDPSQPQSIAGLQDLYDDEIILGGLEFQNAFYIYTNRGIWEMTAVGGDRVFSFNNRYRHREGLMCAQFPNAIVNAGAYHLFATTDGICEWNPFYSVPQRTPWINAADGVIYGGGIKNNCCEEFVSAFSSLRNEVYFSWPSNAAVNCVADQTLILQTRNKVASTLDVGFSALIDYIPYPTDSIRDFLITNCICTLAELVAEGYPYTKEGLPLAAIMPDCAFVPKSIYTKQALDLGGGVIVEDYTKAEPDSDSLCALLGSQRFDDICKKCNADAIFLGVWTNDNCIKHIDGSGYRERRSGTGYVLDGFDSIFRGAPSFSLNGTVRLQRAESEFVAADQNPPSDLNLRIGVSAQSGDPNTDVCGITWTTLTTRPFACGADMTQAQYAATNKRPSKAVIWNMFAEGEFVYWELKLAGTGGVGNISKFSLYGSEHPRCRY